MLFSVIVPIYNVEKFLRRCVDSIIGQTFGDFEVILVDDGSKDGCPAICDEYAEHDKRVKVVHKENGGLVSARCAGIVEAEGDYVFNLDADDAITPDTLEYIADIIGRTDADIISLSYTTTDEDGRFTGKLEDVMPEGLFDRERAQREYYPFLILDDRMRHSFYYVSGKAIRRSLVTEPQLAVDRKISLGEDICCLAPCVLGAERMHFSRKPAYLYTLRQTSISNSFKVERFLQIERVVRSLHTSLDNTGFGFEKQISRYSFYMTLALLASAAEGGNVRLIGDIKKTLLSSELYGEIKKAEFRRISPKSKITLALLRVGAVRTAFFFLYVCGIIKRIIGKGH